MLKLFLKYTIALLLFNHQVNGQCPLPRDMLKQLAAIESNDASKVEKIEQLRRLQKMFLQCYKTKDSVYARIIHRVGFIYSEKGDLAKAINLTKEAVLINSLGNSKSEKAFLANSYFNLNIFYDQLYLRDECHHYLDSCIEISTQFSDKYFIAFRAYERKAFAFFQTGDYQKSIETTDKGILFAKRIRDTLSVVPLLCQKAQALIRLNSIAEAEKNIQNAISILERNNTQKDKLAIAYSIYASLLSKRKDTRSAIIYYEKAFQLNKSIGNMEQSYRDLSNLGFFYDSELHDVTKAMACYTEGMKIAEKAKDAYGRAVLYINMGVAVSRLENYEQSLQYYQKALTVMPINFTDTSIKINPTGKMLRLSANDYFLSTLLSNKGEALLDLYRKRKDSELLLAALDTYEVADKAVDIMRWKQYGEQSKLFWREKTRKMYENAIEACYLSNAPQKAYYFFEKSRAVLLSDKLSELGAKKFIARGDRVKEQQLRAKIFSLRQQLTSVAENSAAYNHARQHLFSAQDEWEKFIKSLEEKYPVYYQYKYNNTVFPFKDIKKNLAKNNQSVVEFFNSDSVVYVLFISKSKEKLLKIPFKDYSIVTKEFMTLCSNESLLNQNYDHYKSLACDLYTKLFRPLEVPEGRVIISPDDHFIPFEALLTDANARASFLLKKYAFSYVYSMSLLIKSSENTGPAKNSLLGVAPVNYEAYMKEPALLGGDASLDKIKPYFSTARFLVREEATKQQFLKNLSLYNVVQIYSHADADSFLKQPVLYLADSLINLNDIQALEECRASLVVLSACKTGTGRNARGEGVFSLARGFMAAGVPSTITTLWQINNQATYTLTEAFYKYLSQGLPKDVALQQAKLEFLETNDGVRQMPYFWASNILLGNGAKLEIKKGISPFYFYIGAGVLLVTSMLFFIRNNRKKTVLS